MIVAGAGFGALLGAPTRYIVTNETPAARARDRRRPAEPVSDRRTDPRQRRWPAASSAWRHNEVAGLSPRLPRILRRCVRRAAARRNVEAARATNARIRSRSGVKSAGSIARSACWRAVRGRDANAHIVWRGLTGRLAIAIEPLIGMLFMGLLTWGIVYRAQHVAADATLIKIAWIFAIGAIAFAGYFIAVLVAPIAAYLQTFKPIYILDGYVRYREPDERSRERRVRLRRRALCGSHRSPCEWEWLGEQRLPERDDSRRWSSFRSTPASTKSTASPPDCCPTTNCRCSRSASPAKIAPKSPSPSERCCARR